MGCPLAAAAFALALHIALTKTNEHLNSPDMTDDATDTHNATITAYMDDINIITHHSNIKHALDTVTTYVEQLGLQLNTTKTECWVHPTAVPPSDTHFSIRRTTRPIVLKTTAEPIPIIPDNPNTPTPYIHEHAPEHQRLLTKRAHTATRLQHLHSQGLTTHVAQALWRTATASDATFTARTIGLDTTTATKLDTITVKLHEEWLDTQLTPHDNFQLFTSINSGGFGFTSTLHIKDTALVASWQQVAPAILTHTGHTNFSELLDQLPNTKAQLQTATNNIDPTLWQTISEITPDIVTKKHQQKQLTTLVRKLNTTTYTNELDTRAMAVHHSTCGIGAGAWLHAPTNNIVPLTNEHFTDAAKLRLDKPFTPQPTQCHKATTNNTCNKHVNVHLDHAISCGFGPHRISRHNKLRDEMADIIHDITGQQPLTEQLLLTKHTPPNTRMKTQDNSTDPTSHSSPPTHLST